MRTDRAELSGLAAVQGPWPWLTSAVGAVLLLTGAWAAVAPPPEGAFVAPMNLAAEASSMASRSLLQSISLAGKRLVAVGSRGHIVFSDDNGKTWTQARVPVQVDLVAVHFPTPQQGWAVGHRGVVLSTSDGGASWRRRFAALDLPELALKHYQTTDPAPRTAAALALASVKRSIGDNAPPSLLDVWFESPTRGTIVGTFNTLWRTEDGGQTWTPWMDRIDNPDELHFYAVRGDTQGVYLAGEKGSVWQLEAAPQRFTRRPTGYIGTLFGLVVHGQDVTAFGMRGQVFASSDAGATWRAVKTPTNIGIVAGTQLPDGSVVLADQAGGLMRSADGVRSFTSLNNGSRLPAFSLAVGADGQLHAAGPQGVVSLTAQSSN